MIYGRGKFVEDFNMGKSYMEGEILLEILIWVSWGF
jgi:hypothetical protein